MQKMAKSERAEKTQELFSRMAHQELLGMSPKAIAQVFGITPAELSKLKATEEYQEVFIKTKAEPQYAHLNANWDTLEALALDSLLESLRHGRGDLENGDLLRIAAMANKAQRRGGLDNAISSSQGNTVVIQLNMNTVNRLTETPKKVFNRPPIHAVQHWGESVDTEEGPSSFELLLDQAEEAFAAS